MRHTSKITIENFQSHSLSEFHLKQGLNVIVGPSDSGKSAVIRALKWALYNEPAGDFFIREGEKECSVTVEFNDGTILKRYRSKSKNGYLLVNSDEVEMRFEGIGSGVPYEITEATGISKINLDQDSSSAINLGEQLEGPFLLSEKPSTRANAIGRLVGVNLLDDALREVLKDIRNISIKKREIEESLAAIDSEISSFDYLDELKVNNLQAKKYIGEATSFENRKIRLEQLNNSLGVINNDKKVQEDNLNNLINIEKASQDIDIIGNNVFKYGVLKGKSISMTELQEEKLLQLDIVKSLENLDKCSNIEAHSSMSLSRLTQITRLNTSLMEISQEIALLNDRLEKLKTTDIAKSSIYDLENHTISHKRLVELSKTYNDAKVGIEKGNKYLNRLNGFLKKEPDLDVTKILLDKLSTLTEINSRLKGIKSSINSTYKEARVNEDNHSSLLKEYGQLLIKIGKCPYCMSDISEATVDHLIKNHLGGD